MGFRDLPPDVQLLIRSLTVIYRWETNRFKRREIARNTVEVYHDEERVVQPHLLAWADRVLDGDDPEWWDRCETMVEDMRDGAKAAVLD